MDADIPEESIASQSPALRRSSRKRGRGDMVKEPIVLEDTPPRKKAARARAPSKKKAASVDHTREDDEVAVVKETVLTTEKNSQNNIPTASAGEKRLRRYCRTRFFFQKSLN
jgi:hypothetical protein